LETDRTAKIGMDNLLLPADIEEILEKYGHLLKSYTNLSDGNSIFGSYKRTPKGWRYCFR
jgi:hypothetical protein